MIGKTIRDLAPSADNNRNSEGAFITLKDGRILFAYSRYTGKGWEDHAEADIYGLLSGDNGESFGKPFPILLHTQLNADNLMSVSFQRMANGDIGMFFLAKKGSRQCLYYLARSCDGGISWGEPVLCSGSQGYYVVNNDRVLRCHNGRLLIPSALHETAACTEEHSNAKTVYRPGRLVIFASDDDGFSWMTISDSVTIPRSGGCTSGVQEPGLVQLDDDTLWCYIRTDSGRQYEVFSRDNGVSWSQPLPSLFTSPKSPLSAKRLHDGRILAVWNPVPAYNGRQTIVNGFYTMGRSPLVMAVSTDDGKTFSVPVPLETYPNCGYCYTAIHETADGAILLGYCAGSPEDASILSRLRIRKITPDVFG